MPTTSFQGLSCQDQMQSELSPSFYITSFIQTTSFSSVSTAVSTSLMILIVSRLPQNMYSRKWKYDLGISNLKLQFKVGFFFFFFCLENLTNVTDWSGQSLRTYSKCYKRKSNQSQSTLSLKCAACQGFVPSRLFLLFWVSLNFILALRKMAPLEELRRKHQRKTALDVLL